MEKCPKCGSYIPEGGKMCIACGWKPEEIDRGIVDEIFLKDNPYLNYLQEVMDTVVEKFPGKDEDEKGSALPLDNDRWIAAASYLGPAFLYTYFVKGKDNELIKYHANQAAVLFAFDVVTNIFRKLPLIGKPMKKLCGLAAFALAFMGARNAVANKQEPLPFLGQLGIEVFQ